MTVLYLYNHMSGFQGAQYKPREPALKLFIAVGSAKGNVHHQQSL